MRIIFLIAILATCCHANAQIALPPKDIPSVDLDHFYDDELYHWWFGYTVEQVRDKIYSEPGWDIKKEEEGEFGSPEGVRLGASYGAGRSKEEIILVSFEFYNRKLQKRGYGFNTNNPLVQTWDAELKKYPYDDRNSRWIDKRHHAEIQRRYANDLVIYVVKMFFEDK